MHVFDFDIPAQRRTYLHQGWVHIRNGVTAEFVHAATAAALGTGETVTGRGVAGEKSQQVFTFPPSVDVRSCVLDVVAATCGLQRETMTLSERHVKAYRHDADPFPAAHKDRFASQVSVGISLSVPQGSHLVLYPGVDDTENPFVNTWLRDSLEPEQLPENVLRDAPSVEIRDSPGDVVMFPGSRCWHLRRHGANTLILYLKFNDFDCDPLGEDEATPVRRAATLTLLAGSPEALLDVVPVLSRRFESVIRDQRREGWPEMLLANVWGQNPFPLSEADAQMLRTLDGTGRVRQVAPEGERFTRLCRLARRGAVDLLARP